MKLHYFKDPTGNFGDDLNPWLWSRLIPDLLDEDEGSLFVGIGTLINHRLPSAPVKHVFGSGFGYGEKPVIDARFVFHAVRGPDTASALGLPASCAVTDSAVLIRAVDTARGGDASGPVGFIPTGQTLDFFDWEPICTQLGLRFISCRWEVDRVLAEMRKCSKLLCEAMHGAIVADALRVPWVPIRCNEDVLAFKWQDWLSTLDLRYDPSSITTLHDHGRDLGALGRLKNSLKRQLDKTPLASANWSAAPPADSSASQIQQAQAQLAAAARRAPTLSDERLLDAHTGELLERLSRMRRAAGAGG
jgi:succinoglycan biosynthesis protein ExoV